MKLRRVLIVLTGTSLLVATLGCTTTPAEIAPTPNIEATVEVRVAHERAIDATVEARVAQVRVAQERAIDAAVVVRLNELVASQPTQTPVAVVREVVPTDTPIPTDNPVPAVRATAVSAASNPQEGSVQQEKPGKQEWVTLTNKDKIFSISVPTNWETTIDLDKLAVEHQTLFAQMVMVAFVGIDPQTGSSVNVMLDMRALMSEEPQPLDRDGYMQIQIEDLKQQPNFSAEISEKEVTMDGIKGTQLSYVVDDEVETMINILLGNEPRMVCGSLGVLITGATLWADKYEIGESELAIVETIFDSFRVLPTAAMTPTCDDRKKLSLLE